MSTKNIARPVRTSKLPFASFPRDYAGLCGVLPPRTIHDETDLANTAEVVHAMALHEKKFTADQEDYFELLCQLIETYEDEHVPLLKRTPLQLLRWLLEQHGQTGADLSRILGAGKNLGNAILRGEREITAEHARTLGKHFAMPAGAFIE